ncbi:MAG: 50S ribosomal protein L34e [Candidatus Hadarchaeales archaeon]
MPAPRFRTAGYGRRKIRGTGGRPREHFRRKAPKGATCGMCGRPLSGIPRVVRALPKSQKKPNRPFGGNLCSSCMREILKERARV